MSDPNAMLGEITRVLARESPRATQAALALRLRRRYGDVDVAKALAHGARTGVLAFDADALPWALASERTTP
jgi:hypothetical protein